MHRFRWFSLLVTSAALLWTAGSASGQSEPRLPVPDAAAQKNSEKLVREIFKDEYAKKDPASRNALARKLIQQALESREDPVSRFVLLREAADISSQGADFLTALRAVELTAQDFEVDGTSLKAGVLAAAAKSPRTPEELKVLASAYMQLVDEALGKDDLEAAEKAASAAGGLARKAKDMPLVTRVETLTRELNEVKGQLAACKKARETLAKQPDEGAANLTVGRFLSLVKGDWEAGLPYLARAAASPLKDLAEKELARPEDPRDQMALADGWWDLGEKEAGKAKETLKARAALWYELARPKATGLAKAKADKRLEEARRGQPGEKKIDLIKLFDPSKDAYPGAWAVQGGVLTMTAQTVCILPYLPPEEYDLRIVVERVERIENLLVGFVMSGHQSAVSIDGSESADVTGLTLLDGKSSVDNETALRGRFLPLNKTCVVVCSVRRTGVALTVNGKKLVDWKGSAARLSCNIAGSISRTDTPFLGGYGKFQFTEVSLIPITGTGKPLR